MCAYMLKFMWAHMFVYVHRHMCMCAYGVFLHCSPFYYLSPGLLNPALSDLAHLTSQLSLEAPWLHLPNTGVTGGPPCHLSMDGVYLGSADLTPDLYTRVDLPSPSWLFYR